ncbi:MAG: winged helix-turn-helix domain-containing protein [Candidatus Nitrosopolaris sp.]
MKYRSRSEIARSILEAAKADEGIGRTKLMYKSYLAYNQLKEYLETLQENGLIDYYVVKRFYKTTEKGIRLSQLQNKLKEIAPIMYITTENS